MAQSAYKFARTIGIGALLAVLIWLAAGAVGFMAFKLLADTRWALSADAAHALGYAVLAGGGFLTTIFLVNGRRSAFTGSAVRRKASDRAAAGAVATNSNDPVSP